MCPHSHWLRWHLISVVIDDVDMCWKSRWLRGHDVWPKQFGLLFTTRTWCRSSRWPHGHRVSVVVNSRTGCQHSRWLFAHDNDYADTSGKLWWLLTGVYIHNSNTLRIWKLPYLQINLQSSIFAKTKKFTKLFLYTFTFRVGNTDTTLLGCSTPKYCYYPGSNTTFLIKSFFTCLLIIQTWSPSSASSWRKICLTIGMWWSIYGNRITKTQQSYTKTV